MRAVVVDRAVPGSLTLADVDPPVPGPAEAVVQVSAISLNLGEVRRSQGAANGWRPGWDLAGTIAQGAADGSPPPPPVGTRVVCPVRAGGWAEQIAVPTHSLAPLPDSVTFAQASTLPVPGSRRSIP